MVRRLGSIEVPGALVLPAVGIACQVRQLLAGIAEELRQRKTGPRRDAAEHHDDEENGGDVDTEHQIAERPERRDPVLPDRERDPRPGS